jgi:uncharacterized membrane protein YidH (DUF202 family)
MQKATLVIALGSISILAGAIALVTLVQRLTERGLDADANGTAGFTTTSDVVQGVAGLVLIVGGIVLAVLGFVRSQREAPTNP